MRQVRLVAAISEKGRGLAGLDVIKRQISRAQTLQDRMVFRSGDGISLAKDFLHQGENDKRPIVCAPHVCYLDLMFPPRTKSSAVKKKMQLLQGLLGKEQRSSENTHGSKIQEER